MTDHIHSNNPAGHDDPHLTSTATTTDTQSTMSLVREALTHVSSLVRSEVDLARTEVSENLNKAVGALVALAVALVCGIVALNTFAAALVAWISNLFDIGVGWSSLIVTILFAVIALAFLSKGRNGLKASSLAPTRTIKNVQRDTQTVKEATK